MRRRTVIVAAVLGLVATAAGRPRAGARRGRAGCVGHRRRQLPAGAGLPRRLAARLCRHPAHGRRRRRRVAGELRPARRHLGVQGRPRRHVGRELRRRRRAGRAQHRDRPAGPRHGHVPLRRPDALGHRRHDLGHRVRARQLPERARLPGRLGPGVPAVLAAGRRRRRHRPLLHRRAAAGRLRGQGRDRPGLGRELRGGRRAGRRRHPLHRDRRGRRRDVQLRPRHPRAEIGVVPAEPVDDAALVRDPVRHPFVDEVLYFAIPDRFANGDTANDCGDFAGVCVAGDTQANVLTHGYLPSDKGYYHGGDLDGLRRQLPYLDRLGIERGVGRPDLRQQERPARHHQPLRPLVRLPRLLDPGLPAGRPPPRHQRGVRAAGGRRPRPRHQGVHGHRHQPHRGRDPARGPRRLPRQDELPVHRHVRAAVRRLPARLLGPAGLPVPRGRRVVVPVHARGAGRRGGRQEPGVAQRPAALPQPGQHQLLRRELALRRLLRPRRPVDRAPRGRRGHGRHLLVLDRGVRGRRLPHRHDQAREHGVLAELRARHPGRGRGAGHRRVLRLRRGVRPAVRLARS